jgi:hypothetical protein
MREEIASERVLESAICCVGLGKNGRDSQSTCLSPRGELYLMAIVISFSLFIVTFGDIIETPNIFRSLIS